MAGEYDWWVNRAAVGMAKATPAIDRQSLEQALARKDDGSWSPSMETIIAAARAHLATLPSMECIIASARLHLATLPKPVWRVTGWFPNDGPLAAPFDAYSHKEALDFARGYLEQGMVNVTVKQVSP